MIRKFPGFPLNLYSSLEIIYGPVMADTYELRLTGALGPESIARLCQLFEDAFAHRVYRLIVNVEGLWYITSAGMETLLSSRAIARAHGGDLILAGMSSQAQGMFELMGLGTILKFAPNTPSAIKLLSNSA